LSGGDGQNGPCEEAIGRGFQSFVEVGLALVKIRDERLYRQDYYDFDQYCLENKNAVPPNQWPGYPPDPDNICAPCNGDNWFMKQSYHWARFGGNVVFHILGECAGKPSSWKGWDNNPGWVSQPFNVDKEGNDHQATYGTFDMTAAIGRPAEQGGLSPGATEINPQGRRLKCGLKLNSKSTKPLLPKFIAT
jgi:hypothetical protein